MPPPPATARALRSPKLLSIDLAGAWVRRDVEHLAAGKVQNVKQKENYHAIAEARSHGQAYAQLLADALEAGDRTAAKQHLARLKEELDRIAIYEARGLDLEGEDDTRDTQRTEEANIKIAHLSAARRSQPDGWRPEGPGCA